jgi:hypothetical protein
VDVQVAGNAATWGEYWALVLTSVSVSVSMAEVTLWPMRFPSYPNTAQEVLLAEPCGHARYV